MIVATSGDQRRTFPHAEAFATWLRYCATPNVWRVHTLQTVPAQGDTRDQRHAR